MATGGARPGPRGAMAGVLLCEPGRLYNALQQQRRLPRLAEHNYLSLLGEDAHGQELCGLTGLVKAQGGLLWVTEALLEGCVAAPLLAVRQGCAAVVLHVEWKAAPCGTWPHRESKI